MLEPEVAALRDALLGLATNSEAQATDWARDIIARLEPTDYCLVHKDNLDGG